MDDIKLNKALLLLALILMLISLLLSVLLNWIDNDTFLKVEQFISYKWMMIILSIIILILLYAFVYNRLFPTANSKSENVGLLSRAQIRNQLKSLTQKEKEYLKKFLDTDERIIKFLRTDEIANGLNSIGILEIISPPEALFPTYSYKISDVYWNYLRKNPKVIDV